MASNPQAKWSTLIGWFSVHFCIFPLSGEIQVEQNKTRNLIFSSQQCNYSHQNLVLHVKGSKFADGRQRLQTLTKRRSVRSLKVTMPYIINNLLTSLVRGHTGEYWPSVVLVWILLRSFFTETTMLQYSPVQPSHLVSKKLFINVRMYMYLCIRSLALFDTSTSEGKLNFP